MQPQAPRRLFSRPQAATSDPQESSHGLFPLLWAPITCLGSNRTFPDQQRGGAPTWPLEHPAFLVKVDLSLPPLYRRESRGCGFVKHAFLVPPRKRSLTRPLSRTLLGLVGLPGLLGGGRRRLEPSRGGRGGTRQAWASGFGWGSLAPPAAAIFPAAVTNLPVSPRAGRSRCPSSCPQTWHPGPGWGGPQGSHMAALSLWRWARKPEPI